MSDKTVARISALLRQAEGTDNQHEAEAFFAAAQKLASLAAIDLAVARTYQPENRAATTPIMRDIVIGPPGKRGLRTYVELFLVIARCNDVTCDIARNSTRVFAYGLPSDIAYCQALYTALVMQMVRASNEFITSKAYTSEKVRRYSASERRWQIKPISAITARLSFQRAFAARIGQRLQQARDAALSESTRAEKPVASSPNAQPSVALALRSKEIAVADFYHQQSTARGRWRGAAAGTQVSRLGMRAGDAAAGRAVLSQQQELGGQQRAVGTRKKKSL